MEHKCSKAKQLKYALAIRIRQPGKYNVTSLALDQPYYYHITSNTEKHGWPDRTEPQRIENNMAAKRNIAKERKSRACFMDIVCGSGHETATALLPGFAINW